MIKLTLYSEIRCLYFEIEYIYTMKTNEYINEKGQRHFGE